MDKSLFFVSQSTGYFSSVGGTPGVNSDLTAYKYPVLEMERRRKLEEAKTSAHTCQCKVPKCKAHPEVCKCVADTDGLVD